MDHLFAVPSSLHVGWGLQHPTSFYARDSNCTDIYISIQLYRSEMQDSIMKFVCIPSTINPLLWTCLTFWSNFIVIFSFVTLSVVELAILINIITEFDLRAKKITFLVIFILPWAVVHSFHCFPAQEKLLMGFSPKTFTNGCISLAIVNWRLFWGGIVKAPFLSNYQLCFQKGSRESVIGNFR